jgi:hypothetical protein
VSAAHPTDDELAAIMAAVSLLWPSPAAGPASEALIEAGPWRFAGRWWMRPTTSRGLPGQAAAGRPRP